MIWPVVQFLSSHVISDLHSSSATGNLTRYLGSGGRPSLEPLDTERSRTGYKPVVDWPPPPSHHLSIVVQVLRLQLLEI